MLVVRCRNPNSAERELIDALQDLDGVAIIGYTVAQGEREREIDALVLTPVRAVAIEVKAPMLATPREGELIPFTNAPWIIGGETAQFYGGANPSIQAKTGAQIFATFLREYLEKTPFIQVAVSVSDADLTMAEGPKMIGQTAVSLTSQIVDSLAQMKKKEVPLEMALEIVEVMNLGILKPTRTDIEQQWKNAEELQKNIQPSEIKSKNKKLSKKDEPKSPFFEWMEKFSSAFNSATVVFLLVWFLYSIGVLDATIELFDSLQEIVSTAISNKPPRDAPVGN